MSYVAPSTRSAGALITASIWNQDVVANPAALYSGALGLASQAANDFIYASSATQLARLAAAAQSSPRYSGSAWEMKKLMRTLFEDQPGTSNSGTGETTLWSDTLAANTLAANGERIRIEWMCTRAGNTNTKTIRLKLAGTTLYSNGTNNATHVGGWFVVDIIRTGGSAEVVLSDLSNGTGAGYSTAAIDITTNQTLLISGQSDTAGGDITLRDVLVRHIPIV